ncbi:MAG TPA: outer membrane lipoprotein chaperone LolA [Bryobacteraceae bacterium]|nr:outer membrane lipoprotein chaperone LolA [Bryobacteraceae bacterium]
MSAFAADPSLDKLLKSVENRYNKAKTLQVSFNEAYTPKGKAPRAEGGLLMLRKPGRMRWEYSQPKGKLFVSDGKSLWLYTPDANRAERMPLKDSEDMHAPLAFLLGRLKFDKDFQNLKGSQEGGLTRVTAQPKTDNLPYTAVEFVVSPDSQIREVKVTGFDDSILDFHFQGETLNPSLDDKLFEYKAPPGVEVVDEEQ